MGARYQIEARLARWLLMCHDAMTAMKSRCLQPHRGWLQERLAAAPSEAVRILAAGRGVAASHVSALQSAILRVHTFAGFGWARSQEGVTERHSHHDIGGTQRPP